MRRFKVWCTRRNRRSRSNRRIRTIRTLRSTTSKRGAPAEVDLDISRFGVPRWGGGNFEGSLEEVAQRGEIRASSMAPNPRPGRVLICRHFGVCVAVRGLGRVLGRPSSSTAGALQSSERSGLHICPEETLRLEGQLVLPQRSDPVNRICVLLQRGITSGGNSSFD